MESRWGRIIDTPEAMPIPSAVDLLVEGVRSIEHWPDYQFTTPDGRTFGLFLFGESIAYRMAAVHWAGAEEKLREKDELEGIAGMILEVGATDQPFIFKSADELTAAWVEHHRVFGVPLSDEEREVLDLGSEEEEKG